MIKSFNDIDAQDIFNGYSVKKYKAIEEVIRRKLRSDIYEVEIVDYH